MKSRKPNRRTGKGYKLGPHSPKLLPADAHWATSVQVRARYGNVSDMWLWRRVRYDPLFPKPTYFGRLMMFSVAALDEYDRAMILNNTGKRRTNAAPRKVAQPSLKNVGSES